MLLSELRRRNPAAERVQHLRAARWFEQDGDIDAALEHARAAADHNLAAEIIGRHLVTYLSTGRASTLRHWIEMLPAQALADLPWFGAIATQAYISNGDIERATYWLAVAERGAEEEEGSLPDGRVSLRAAVAIARASLGIAGVGQMGRDASIGYDAQPDGSPWKPFCAFLQGVSLHLSGDRAAAVDKLREAVVGMSLEISNIHALALAQLAICAMEEEDWEQARDLAERARDGVERNGLQDYTSASLVYAASAMSCAHWRQPAEALRDVRRATRLLATLSGLAPWMSIEGAIICANVYLVLGNPAQAREMLRPVQRGFTQLPDAPLLRQRYEEMLDLVGSQRDVTKGGPPLTAAEIRVVQFLPTHLSFREIAERLHVSRNTIKTQVISVYRKLGVEHRTAAVEAARALGMIEGGFSLAV
jgi:LuxR family maltose regulon positive regulatory protein